MKTKKEPLRLHQEAVSFRIILAVNGKVLAFIKTHLIAPSIYRNLNCSRPALINFKSLPNFYYREKLLTNQRKSSILLKLQRQKNSSLKPNFKTTINRRTT